MAETKGRKGGTWYRGAVLAAVVGLTACSAQQHMGSVRAAADGDRVTVGTVQKEIRVGMSSADVVAQLGSPNIVATDSQGREVWTYDKFATESVRQSSQGGLSALVLGLTPILGATGGYGSSAGASSTSQRTLTVIIKFDDAGLVRDFSYHTSRF